MTLVFAAIIALASVVLLSRILWLRGSTSASTLIITGLVAAMLASLVILTATGRLHWIAAVVAAVVPFLRRILGLVLRSLPLLARFAGPLSSWIEKRFGSRPPPPDSGQAMSVSQAQQILGLEAPFSNDEVIAAHRRLMQRVHPDRGGSTFLAQQLNQAKDTLLG